MGCYKHQGDDGTLDLPHEITSFNEGDKKYAKKGKASSV